MTLVYVNGKWIYRRPMHYLRTYEGTWTSLPAGGSDRSNFLRCPSNEVVIGGGVETRGGGRYPDIRIMNSAPDFQNQIWNGYVFNFSVVSAEFRIKLVCWSAYTN